MEDKENLVDWIDNQFVEHAKRLGLEVQMIDNPKKSNQENASISGTITFLKGDSVKKAAAIMASRRGKTIRDYEGILLHIPHSSTSFPSESTNSFSDLDEDEKLLIDYYTDELFVPRELERNICSVVFFILRLFLTKLGSLLTCHCMSLSSHPLYQTNLKSNLKS